MNNKYKVVYSGKLKAGVEAEQFIQSFMQAFKVPEEHARKVAAITRPTTIKADLDQAAAEKYRQVMDRLGMEVQVEAMAGATGLSLAAVEGGAPAVPPSVAVPAAPVGSVAAGNGERCPKCGSDRVQGDDCLACGIIISRYREKQARLAAEAAAQDSNPYAAPQSDITPPRSDDAGALTGPHGVPAGHGWQWIAGGWGHFKQNPLAWIGAVVVWVVLMMVLSLVPLLGSLAVNLLTPVLTAGFMLGAHEQRQGGSFELRHLFAGFSRNPGSLILVGVLYLVGMIGIFVVVGMTVGGAVFAMAGGMQGGARDAEMAAMMLQGPMLLAVLIAMALILPLMMAYWFAPALVALEDIKPLQAMGLSFRACLKNVLPFLIYSLAALVLMIVAMIPFGLGLLVLMPVMLAAMYVSYRDIFYAPE
ncbi:BPSS1780 family membrane protein [Sulfurivermis fontis]|uniref:BPSS1780 family membrane protein n=1 Tax=Sulfurivermis fontis TaxID=1972068 RepID=UPI0018D4F19A|nr:BPSS1780 family membrane protein [Sulfurivermis fontis]